MNIPQNMKMLKNMKIAKTISRNSSFVFYAIPYKQKYKKRVHENSLKMKT